MSNRTWKVAAILACAIAGVSAALCAVYVGILVVQGANALFGVLAGALVGESLTRKVLMFMTWWWPEQADPIWLAKHPPLFRLDRFRKRT